MDYQTEVAKGAVEPLKDRLSTDKENEVRKQPAIALYNLGCGSAERKRFRFKRFPSFVSSYVLPDSHPALY